jgi:PAS domain S-box-containing protein
MPQKPSYEELELRVKELERSVVELRKNEEILRDLAENLPIPVSIGTTALDTIYINPKFTEVFGFTAKDLPDQKAWQHNFFQDPEYRQTIAREVDEWLASGANQLFSSGVTPINGTETTMSLFMYFV